MNKITLAVFLISLVVPFQSATAQLACQEDSHPDCNDGFLLNGYWWHKTGSVWTPFFPSLESWFRTTPVWTKGTALFYEPGPMEATANVRGLDLTGYKGGVALMSPSDIGQEVWLRPPGKEWDGPFLVVDTAEWDDIFPQILLFDEVIEVDWYTAIDWGMVSPSGKPLLWKLPDVEVSKIPPDQLRGCPIDYPKWWIDLAESAQKNIIIKTPYYRAPRDWHLDGEWHTYASPTRIDLIREQNLYQDYLSCQPAPILGNWD